MKSFKGQNYDPNVITGGQEYPDTSKNGPGMVQEPLGSHMAKNIFPQKFIISERNIFNDFESLRRSPATF